MPTSSQPYVDREPTDEEIRAYVEAQAIEALRAANFRTWVAARFAEIEERNVSVHVMAVHGSFYRLIQNYARDSDFDPITRLEVVKTGLMGRLWGAWVMMDKDVPEGCVRLYGKDEVHAYDIVHAQLG